MNKKDKEENTYDFFFYILIIYRREECPSEVQRHNHHGAE